MSISTSNHAGRSYCDINMTPLIDVMLVLLIIFIITLPAQTHAIKIENPLTMKPRQSKPEVIDLQIEFDGARRWNREAVDRARMLRYINADAGKSPQPEVHITVDRFAHYEIVAQTLADLQLHGLKAIGFVNDVAR